MPNYSRSPLAARGASTGSRARNGSYDPHGVGVFGRAEGNPGHPLSQRAIANVALFFLDAVHFRVAHFDSLLAEPALAEVDRADLENAACTG